ncbi:MAG: phosphoglycerol transferase [Congregibacter sp.]
MIFYALNILFLALVLVGIRRRSLVTAIIVGCVTSVFLILSGVQIVANRFTGAGVDQSVFFHLSVGFDGAGWQEYIPGIVISALFIAASLAIPVMLYILGRSRNMEKPHPLAFFAILALPVCVFLHPTTTQTLGLLNVSLVPQSESEKRQEKAGKEQLFERFFEEPGELGSGNNNNLVFIYLESFERTYLDEKLFPGLAPNLAALEKQSLYFTDVLSYRGTGFTIGGLVASQCGLPLLTAGSSNSMRGMDQFLPKASCLGDLLSETGMSMNYLGGADLDFAGKGKFLSTHGFSHPKGLKDLGPQLPDPSYVSSWGLYDDSLLDQLRSTHRTLKGKNAPYALFALTMDTHHPNGHQSASCTKPYRDGSNKMLNAVHCSDRLVSTLIREIRQSEDFENTVLVVASDHTALRNAASDLLGKGRRRNLFMIFTAAQAGGVAISRRASTFDIAPTVLSALGWENTSIGLGRNLLKGKPTFREAIADLNGDTLIGAWSEDVNAFWQFPSAQEGFEVLPEESVVVMQNRRFALPIVIEFDDNLNVRTNVFEFDTRGTLTQYLLARTTDDAIGWIDDCSKVRAMNLALRDHGLCLFVGALSSEDTIEREINGNTKLTASTLSKALQSATRGSLSAERRQRLRSLNTHGVPDVVMYNEKLAQANILGPVSVLSSAGPKTRSYIQTTKNKLMLPRGVNLVRVNNAGRASLVENFDACKIGADVAKAPTRDFAVNRSPSLAALFIVVHDSGICSDDTLTISVNGQNQAFSKIGFRAPYVARLSADGELQSQHLGERYTKLAVELGN